MTPMDNARPDAPGASQEDRRSIVSASTAAMAAGLAASYGFFAYIAARFLYPSRSARRQWMFVAKVADVVQGTSIAFRTPAGETVTIARRKSTGATSDFIALSSTCPHLGCKVRWEAHNNRFFCPCHNGVFTPEGKAIAGPPADAGQSLSSFPLEIRNGLLYIQVPTEVLVGDAGGDAGVIEEPEGPPGPGHDPCLFPDFRTPPRHV